MPQSSYNSRDLEKDYTDQALSDEKWLESIRELATPLPEGQKWRRNPFMQALAARLLRIMDQRVVMERARTEERKARYMILIETYTHEDAEMVYRRVLHAFQDCDGVGGTYLLPKAKKGGR